MLTPYEEILQILADVELENDIPNNTLKKIYEKEKPVVHLRVRTQIHDPLQRIVSETVKEINENAV